jgi:hypothetical protein
MHESAEHAALVDLFRTNPGLTAQLAAQLGNFELPPDYTATSADPVIRVVNLASDALTLVRDAQGHLRMSIPVEVQRSIDPDKKEVWPLYLWHRKAGPDSESCVLIVATTRKVAEWARRTIRGGPGNEMRVLVLCADDIPRITDPTAARANPALAVLSATFHGGNTGVGLQVVRAAIAVLPLLPRAAARSYRYLIYRNLNPDEIRNIEDTSMQDAPKDIYRADPERPYNGWIELCEKLENVPTERVLRAFDYLIAKQKAQIADRVKVLLRQLDRRGFTVEPAMLALMDSCDDLNHIDTWLDRVLFASSAADVFAPIPE